MDKLSDLKHLFVTVFLANFALNVIPPAITDITVGALCPSQDECSLAIYLSGFQQAVCNPDLTCDLWIILTNSRYALSDYQFTSADFRS